MFKDSKIFSSYTGKLSKADLSALAEEVKDAFTYGIKQGLADRRNREADLFCEGQKYTHNKVE